MNPTNKEQNAIWETNGNVVKNDWKTFECNFSSAGLNQRPTPHYIPHLFDGKQKKLHSKVPNVDDLPEYNNVPLLEMCATQKAQQLKLNFCGDAGDVDNEEPTTSSVDDVIDMQFSRIIEMLQKNFDRASPIARHSSKKVADRLRHTDNLDILSPTSEVADSLQLFPADSDVFPVPAAECLSSSHICLCCRHYCGEALREKRPTLVAFDTVNTDTTTTTTTSATTIADSMGDVSAWQRTRTLKSGGAIDLSRDDNCVTAPSVVLTFRKYRLTSHPETTV